MICLIENLACPPIDLGLILDSSRSLDFGNNERAIQEFAKGLVNSFDVNPGVNGTHVSIVQFDNSPTTLLRFTDSQSRENVENKIDTYEVREGQTFLNRAIDQMDQLFTRAAGMRGPEYERVGISAYSGEL